MKAAVFEDIRRMPIREVAKPQLQEGGLILRVEACGLCGTDVRIFNHGHQRISPPRIIGHEVAGVVESVGGEVKGFQEGDRVVLFPGVACGRCYVCQEGRPNICPRKIGLGYEWDGGYAEYLSVPRVAMQNLIPIPPSLPFDEASLMEPLSCCIHGQERLNISPQDQVLIIGAGPIGVMHLLLAKGKGVAKTILLEVQEERLESALLFEPDLLLDAREGDVEGRVGEETEGRGADVVIVACSSASAQEQAVRLVGKGGRILFFAGLPREAPSIRFDSNRIHYEEISVYGSFASRLEQGREALGLIAARPSDFGRLITHRLPLEDILKGIDLVEKGRGLKVIIRPGG